MQIGSTVLFHPWAVLLTGLGGVKNRKPPFVLPRSLLQQNPSQSLVRLTAHPEQCYQAMLSSKGQGKELGVAWRSVVLALEVGVSAGRADLHEAGGCVRKKGCHCRVLGSDLRFQSFFLKHIKKPDYVTTGIVPDWGDSIEVKNEDQIQGLREACQLARHVLLLAGKSLKVVSYQASARPADGLPLPFCLSLLSLIY